MNERITKLMIQAIGGVPCYDASVGLSLNQEEAEKFAELIVRQMSDITDAHTEVFQTDRDRALIEHIKQSVKQHFGVEE